MLKKMSLPPDHECVILKSTGRHRRREIVSALMLWMLSVWLMLLQIEWLWCRRRNRAVQVASFATWRSQLPYAVKVLYRNQALRRREEGTLRGVTNLFTYLNGDIPYMLHGIDSLHQLVSHSRLSSPACHNMTSAVFFFLGENRLVLVVSRSVAE